MSVNVSYGIADHEHFSRNLNINEQWIRNRKKHCGLIGFLSAAGVHNGGMKCVLSGCVEQKFLFRWNNRI